MCTVATFWQWTPNAFIDVQHCYLGIVLFCVALQSDCLAVFLPVPEAHVTPLHETLCMACFSQAEMWSNVTPLHETLCMVCFSKAEMWSNITPLHETLCIACFSKAEMWSNITPLHVTLCKACLLKLKCGLMLHHYIRIYAWPVSLKLKCIPMLHLYNITWEPLHGMFLWSLNIVFSRQFHAISPLQNVLYETPCIARFSEAEM